MFPGNKFLNPVLMAVFVTAFILCFSSVRGKVSAEAERWHKEAEVELAKLDSLNRMEIAGEKVCLSQ